jgi:23S rRNA (guanine745-N1)-methyltransferase
VIPEILATLRCPVCRGALAEAPPSLACAEGHSYVVARQGYASFLVGRPSGLVGDDAAMVDARSRILEAGHFAPLSEAVIAAAAGAPPGPVMDVGAGTGWYLARLLDAERGRAGLALDLSKYAARRASRSHPRVVAATADASQRLPVGDGVFALALDLFAPRNGPELRRVLRSGGVLVIAAAAPDHLQELRQPLGLVEVAAGKEERLARALSPGFVRAAAVPLRWTLRLSRAEAVALAGMGPTARHVAPDVLAWRARELPDSMEVTGSVSVERWLVTPTESP